MSSHRQAIAASFDTRAESYERNDWHRRCAERLVALCRLAPASNVLDACTGTGFAALAAARAVGPEGRVLRVDISPGMLKRAEAAVRASGFTNVNLLEADVVDLRQFESGTLDAITCAAGLLYLPAAPTKNDEPDDGRNRHHGSSASRRKPRE